MHDGVLTTTLNKTGATYELNESEMPLDYESCCGYFYNEELTKTIKDNVVDLSKGDVCLYTKRAVLTSNITFTLDSETQTYTVVLPVTGGHQGGTIGFAPQKVYNVINIDSSTNEYVLPKEYNGKPVQTIQSQGLTQESLLAEGGCFILCDNIKIVGPSTFYGYDGYINICDSIQEIGSYAFSGCSGLTGSLIIPDSVTSIGKLAFNNCSGLTSIYIPGSLTTMAVSIYHDSPFYNCSSSLVFYTDVTNASSKPSGWGTYWNYKTLSETYTTKYGYTLDQYKAEVGITTFVDEKTPDESEKIEVIRFCNDVNNQEIILNEKNNSVVTLKENKMVA